MTFRENIIAHLQKEIDGGNALLELYESERPGQTEHAQVWFKTNAYRDMLERLNNGEFDDTKTPTATELQPTQL